VELPVLLLAFGRAVTDDFAATTRQESPPFVVFSTAIADPFWFGGASATLLLEPFEILYGLFGYSFTQTGVALEKVEDTLGRI
jgi:hypothetical protein